MWIPWVLPVRSPVILPVILPVRFPVTLPVTLPVNAPENVVADIIPDAFISPTELIPTPLPPTISGLSPIWIVDFGFVVAIPTVPPVL